MIFQENVSFDHYFATYPYAANPPGEPPFHAKPGTPSVNGLNETLLTKNPNALQPHPIDRAHVATADQNHDYTAEQQAFDHGLMDQFVECTGSPENGVADKWSVLALGLLAHGPQRFNQLRRQIEGLAAVTPSARIESLHVSSG